jgi:MFS family permease
LGAYEKQQSLLYSNPPLETTSMDRPPTTRSAWLILLVLLAASVAAPLNQFKVPPLLPLLMETFELPVSRAGSLMSVFTLAGLILALPSGFILQRLGYRLTGLMAIGAVILGAALGALSQAVGPLLFSRVVEGLGVSLMGVTAPVVIALWFAAERRATAMGVWAAWYPLGAIIMLVIAPWMAGHWQWQSVWWFGCLFAAAGFLLFLVFIRPRSKGEAPRVRLTAADVRQVLLSRDLWFLCVFFLLLNLPLIAFATWAPTYFHQALRVSLAKASLLSAVPALPSMVAAPFGGWLSDRLRSRKVVCLYPVLAITLVWPLVPLLKLGQVLPFMLAFGFVTGLIAPGVFAAAAEIVRNERLGGLAMAVIMLGQNGGMLVGPIFFGWMVEKTGGWTYAFWSLVPICALAAVVMARIRIR